MRPVNRRRAAALTCAFVTTLLAAIIVLGVSDGALPTPGGQSASGGAAVVFDQGAETQPTQTGSSENAAATDEASSQQGSDNETTSEVADESGEAATEAPGESSDEPADATAADDATDADAASEPTASDPATSLPTSGSFDPDVHVEHDTVVVEDEGLPAHEANVVLVSVPEGTTREELQELLAASDFVDTSSISDRDLSIGLVSLPVATDVSLTDAIDALERTPGIDGAQPNFVYKMAAAVTTEAEDASGAVALSAALDPASVYATYPINDADAIGFSTADGYNPDDGYWQLQSVNAFGAWQLLGYDKTAATNPIGIAVIDSGANINQLDLVDRITDTYNSYYVESNETYGTSYDPDAASSVTDTYGHGTHVAGIAGATANNGVGIAGIAYSPNLVVIKASNSSNDFTTKSLVYAYDWLLTDDAGSSSASATTHAEASNVRVINMSLGGAADVATWEQDAGLFEQITAAKEAGILTVAAAGNDGEGGPYNHVPGDYEDVLAVINLNHTYLGDDTSTANDASGSYVVERDSSSNYNVSAATQSSRYSKDISAPGTDIWSTYKYDRIYNTEYFSWGNDVTIKMTGTSMASPLVAGVAALVYAAGEQGGADLSADTVRSIIEGSAHDLGATGWNAETGYGEVDAQAAVTRTLGTYIVGNRIVGVGEDAGAETYQVMQAGSAVSGFAWSSSAPAVATIDAGTGALTPIAAGTTTITATSADKSASMTVTVIDPTIENAAEGGDPAFIWSVDSETYEVTGDGTDGCVWLWSIENDNVSSDASNPVVSIGENSGVLVTKASELSEEKTVDVVATCASNANIKRRLTVTVKPEPAIIGDTQVYLGFGSSYAVSNTESGWTWTWTSSNTGVATVDASTGALTTVAAGKTTLTATLAGDDAKQVTLVVEVVDPAIAGVSTIPVGGSSSYSLNSYLDGYTISWSATMGGAALDESVAKMDVSTDTPMPSISALDYSETPILLSVTISDGSGTSVSRQQEISIIYAELSKLDIDVTFPQLAQDSSGKYYTTFLNQQIKPEVVVTLNNGATTLVGGEDYKVTYGDNCNAGTDAGTVTITGISPYVGSYTVHFDITQQSIARASAGYVWPQTYRASQIRPTAPTLSYYGTLTADTDYEVSYGTNVNAGVGTIVYTGKGNFTGTKTVQFYITPLSLSSLTVNGSYTYTGSQIKPKISVSAAYGTPTYSVSYGTNVNAGSGAGTVVVRGTGNYTGTLSRSFDISRVNISKARVYVTSQTYTGSALKPAPTVIWNGKVLTAGTDYTTSYANNVKVGTATVIVTGKGNFTGSTSTTFAVVGSSSSSSGASSGNSSSSASSSASSSGASSSSASSVSRITMYRVYNPNSGEHFYTASAAERDSIVAAGWVDEGIGWYAPSSSSTPVYRLYSGTDHHYTTNASERDYLVSVGWADEGIGWYSDDAQATPLYRQYNPRVNPKASRNNSGSHNYTTSKDENDFLVSVGWVAEGIGWYGL